MSGFVQLELPLPAAPMRLSAADRELKALLGRLAGRHSEVWHATETIAQRLGITVRAAQLRIQRLEILGLVRRTWDYTRNTRRRLVLLWRSVSAAPCAESAQGSSPTAEIPPICASAESEEENTLSSYAAPAPPPPPDVVVQAREPEKTGPTPDQKARIEAAVKAVAPADAGFRGKVAVAAARHGAKVVLAALADMADAAKRTRIESPARFFWSVVNDMVRSGVEPPDPGEAEASRRAEEEAARQRAIAYWSGV